MGNQIMTPEAFQAKAENAFLANLTRVRELQDECAEYGAVVVNAKWHSNMVAALSAISDGHGVWGLDAKSVKGIARAALVSPDG